MTRTIDIPTFQAAVVRNCSPTLAGIKPSSLFTYPGAYASQNGKPGNPHIEARRTHLLAVIAQCNRELQPFGIHTSVLVWRPCGALIYVYRPADLMRYLSDPRATTALAAAGYDIHNLPASLVHLAARITLASSNATESACADVPCVLAQSEPCGDGCTCEFPHEIGYFLGYPYEDVRQFIVQHGENYKVFGPWKVYTNVGQALATFESYRACTQHLTHVYQQGHSLAKLAQATR